MRCFITIRNIVRIPGLEHAQMRIELPSTVLLATFSELADHCCRYGIGGSTCKCTSDPRPS
nr:AlNc14C158G7709 [Albugo laibachii Nc14]|eukprot:CCA22554.1 AlNc14C158G7709 [Albugo laibachii Nc14]